MNFINKNISQLSFKQSLIVYLIFILVVSLLTALYANLIISKFEIADINNNIIFSSLQFDYGELTENFFYSGDFSQIRTENKIKYYLFKSPLLAIILCYTAKISTNIYFIFIFKNIITFSILFISLFISLRLNFKLYVFLFILIAFMLNPYNIHVSLNIFFEDNLIALLLPSLFILLICDDKKRFYLISIILFFLYLSKSSMLILTLILPLIFFIFERNKKILKSLPLLSVIFAILIWGFFGYNKTGRFPFAGSLITSNSEALHNVVLNKEFLDYYPYKSVDLIPNNNKIPKDLSTEWEVFDYYNVKNKRFLQDNFYLYLQGIPVKIKFIFFNIYKDSTFPDDNNKFNNELMFSYLANKIIFNLAIIIFVIRLYLIAKNKKNFYKIYDFKIDIYFFLILLLSLLPHVIAWATAKHLVAVQQVCLIYIIWNFFRKFDQKNDFFK